MIKLDVSTDIGSLILNIERETGFTNIQISKCHPKNGNGNAKPRWTMYTRFLDRDGKWQSNFIGSINSNGIVYLTRLNNQSVGTINVEVLPEEKINNGSSNAQQSEIESDASSFIPEAEGAQQGEQGEQGK